MCSLSIPKHIVVHSNEWWYLSVSRLIQRTQPLHCSTGPPLSSDNTHFPAKSKIKGEAHKHTYSQSWQSCIKNTFVTLGPDESSHMSAIWRWLLLGIDLIAPVCSALCHWRTPRWATAHCRQHPFSWIHGTFPRIDRTSLRMVARKWCRLRRRQIQTFCHLLHTTRNRSKAGDIIAGIQPLAQRYEHKCP